MRKKNVEVTGKPTQYNLQTLEYNWGELPDTHFKVKENGPRIRDYAIPAGAPSGGNVSDNMRAILGGGDVAGAGAGAGARAPANNENSRSVRQAPPSPQPAPMPSRPQQEDFAVQRGNGNANGGAARNLDPGALRGGGGNDLGQQYAAMHQPQPQLPQYQQQPQQQRLEPAAYVTPWSHEDLRRQVLMSQVEAGHNYLHQFL